MGSAGQQKQSSSGSQSSGTKFPYEFIKPAGDYLGRLPSLEDLVNLAPRTSGLFGGSTGINYGQQGQSQASAGLSDLAQPQGASQQSRPPTTFGLSDVAGILAGEDHGKYRVDALNSMLKGAGYDPNAFSLDQAKKVLTDRTSRWTNDPMMQRALGALGVTEAPQQSQFSPSEAPPVGLGSLIKGGIGAGLQNLGFGATPNTYQQREVEQAPAIAPRGIDEMFTPEGRQQLTNEIFESQYRPLEREMTRQAGLADQQLNAQLAQAGLASSGTGIGQRAQQSGEFSRRMQQTAQDAASQAAVQAQQARLQASGLDLQAQTASAQNILSGNIANATNYLQAMGLNEEAANNARGSFLNLLGLQEQDLARMDAASLNSLTAMIQPFLQEWGLLGDLGKYGEGQQSSRGSGWNAGIM